MNEYMVGHWANTVYAIRLLVRVVAPREATGSESRASNEQGNEPRTYRGPSTAKRDST
jgi:hypothetical protein